MIKSLLVVLALTLTPFASHANTGQPSAVSEPTQTAKPLAPKAVKRSPDWQWTVTILSALLGAITGAIITSESRTRHQKASDEEKLKAFRASLYFEFVHTAAMIAEPLQFNPSQKGVQRFNLTKSLPPNWQGLTAASCDRALNFNPALSQTEVRIITSLRLQVFVARQAMQTAAPDSATSKITYLCLFKLIEAAGTLRSIGQLELSSEDERRTNGFARVFLPLIKEPLISEFDKRNGISIDPNILELLAKFEEPSKEASNAV